MITNIPFQTRARTIDHLGREQIADCPTAISELWKNAYDAYARTVSLHVFEGIDGSEQVAAVLDDGHGMSRKEFENKWLVVGTDSKVTDKETPEEDRNGLPIRPRQGQKGIGRLSSGIMGSFLLLISKRNNSDYVASLIDWRIFENPYLLLQDISLPVIEFSEKKDLIENLPGMYDALIDNVWPNSNDKNRNERVRLAWEMFDNIEEEEGILESTSKRIESTIIDTVFNNYHFSKWEVWNNQKDNGTALFVSNISFELRGLLESETFSDDDINQVSKENIFRTLSGFYDPYKKNEESFDNNELVKDTFHYEVFTWKGEQSREFLAADTQFKLEDLFHLEHFVIGKFDINGIFRGSVRAFGEDLGEIEIPPNQISWSKHSRDRVGPFDIAIGSFEAQRLNTTHSDNEFSKIEEQAKKYSGLGVYRDLLRVLPYGKPDNDFFGIEEQRSKQLGAFFWSNRKAFGRVSITREDNKNLRDKAGREGLIDNRARTIFRNLVFGLLKEVAKRYFGSNASLRKERLPLIQEANKKIQQEAAKKLRKENRSIFRKTLRSNEDSLKQLFKDFYKSKEENNAYIALDDGDSLFVNMEDLEELRKKRTELRLPPAPRKLGALEDEYNSYRNRFIDISKQLDEEYERLYLEIARLKPRTSEEIAYSSLRSNAKALHDRLRKWKKLIIESLESEIKKIDMKISNDNKLYDLKTVSLIDDLSNNRISLIYVLQELDEIRNNLDIEYEEFYVPYLRSITKLKQGIDLDSAGTWNSERAEQLEEELAQFTNLAQLGITVELVSHELERLDHSIGNHLRDLPPDVQLKPSFKAAFTAHQELMNRLRFLSPLKLSGRSRSRTLITGQMIYNYLSDFFGNTFKENQITFIASDEFQKIAFEDYPSQIYPVFINLVNNSRYWVMQNDKERKILLGIVNNKIVISDSGPGVSYSDQDNLFKLFFTRRINGRGVGLYLCKTNLEKNKHLIEYAKEEQYKILSGANFVLEIRGLTNENKL